MYEDRTKPFEPGSFLFTYSDALIEEITDTRAALEETGLKAMVERIMATKPAKPMKTLIDEFFQTYRRPPLGDDLTGVWLARPKA